MRLPAATVMSFLIALFVLRADLRAQKGADFVADSEAARRLAALVDRGETFGLRGAVLATWDGKVLIARGRSDDVDRYGVDAETRFEIASTTKQFTAAAILRLAELKKLELDDSIAKHLPMVPPDCEAITIRHLLQHSSGIPGTNSRGGGDDLAAVVPIFLEGGPRHEPGTHWEYWNQGYALLAGIIERRSGKSYADFCRDELFKKAKMKTAGFTGDEPKKGQKFATGASERGDRSAVAHPYGEYGYQYRGMGGAICSLWDLWAWDRALNGNRVLKKDSRDLLLDPGLEDYALGWFVRKRGARRIQSHAGSVRGFLADLRRYVDDDGCLVVLLNDDRQPLYSIAALFESCLLGEDYPMPPKPLDVETRRSLVGRYESKDGTRLELEEVRGALQAGIFWGGAGRPTIGFVGEGQAEGRYQFFDFQSLIGMSVDLRDGAVAAIRLEGDRVFERRR